jgi:glyoxylase-like metal-dependent hydrolase (beta-lactamase superfamily II)
VQNVAEAAGPHWKTSFEDFVGVPVAPGVWGTALPFPSPLRSSFSYLVRTEDGVIVVDLGWDTDEGWDRFLRGLDRAGISIDEITGVVITHLHPDHHGLAERLGQYSSAWTAVHPAERSALALTPEAAENRLAEMAAWLRRCGCPDAQVTELIGESQVVASGFLRRDPERDLTDGEAVPGSAGALVTVHTPGHTPGHVCLHDRSRGLLFTGDHLLPRISPNISKRPTSDIDPLADYTASLRQLSSLSGAVTTQALPGHEWGFGGMLQRAEGLLAHHEVRLAEVEEAVQRGARTVWEVASHINWSRPMADLGPRARRSAVGETHSHLYRLFTLGRLVLHEGEPDQWFLRNSPGSTPH